MLAASASLLNINIVILDVGDRAPAKQVFSSKTPALAHVDGSYSDPDKIRELAAKVDVLTVEIEHVDASVLQDLESSNTCAVYPSASTIKIIQDKFVQKTHLANYGCPVSEFIQVESTVNSLQAAADTLGLPFMLKSRTLAYDGRGNFVVENSSHFEPALSALASRPLYAERWVPFIKEIAVMVVRSAAGEISAYPAVETVHKDNICHLVFAPLRSRDPVLATRAQAIAENAVKSLKGVGVFGVEMFLLADGAYSSSHHPCRKQYISGSLLSGSIYLNEIAPRPHNSGHYTIEACETSQYENHLRAILGLSLGSTALKVPSAAMLNVIGASSDMGEITRIAERALAVPGASIHLYGKAECRKGRKMGHITIVAQSDAELRARLRILLQCLPIANAEEIDKDFAPAPPVTAHSHKYPLVGVIMGSDSDLPVMLPAARILDKFEIPYELTIVSAHRTPDRLVEYARSAAARGLRAIIAGAGGAAHLPGMVAAMTAIPVVGVPVKGSSLDGVDSLHSIVQMPVCVHIRAPRFGDFADVLIREAYQLRPSQLTMV